MSIEQRLAHLVEEAAARHLVEMGLIEPRGVFRIRMAKRHSTVEHYETCGNGYRRVVTGVETEAELAVSEFSHDSRVLLSAMENKQPVRVQNLPGDCDWLVHSYRRERGYWLNNFIFQLKGIAA